MAHRRKRKLKRRGYKTRNKFKMQKRKNKKLNSYRVARGGIRL